MERAPVSAWVEAYDAATQPGLADMAAFVGTPEWGALRKRLEDTCGAAPLVEYSGCAAQPGWNVKYRKGGKALCTLYPMRGYFIAMVSVAPKQEEAAALLLPGLSAYTQALYTRSKASKMGRWLMLEVRGEDTMADVLRLVALRMNKG